MIRETYCSFETAKLLKDKGFKERCDYYYTKHGDLTDCLVVGYADGNRVICKDHTLFPYSAPTQAMAMGWLREIHNIYIMIDKDFATTDGWHYFIATKDMWKNSKAIQQKSNNYTYEEACEEAIKYCLENLI